MILSIYWVNKKYTQPWLSLLALTHILFISSIWLSMPASNDRLWTADQEHFPEIKIKNNMITINNFRHSHYRSQTDFDARWKSTSVDLNQLVSVDFLVEHFSVIEGIAHTFLTFGFEDGNHIAISVEIRKEIGEYYSPVAALFRRYELIYVIGDERDLIGMRTEHRKNPVYLFPIKASKEEIQTLFLSMLDKAHELESQPQYYNTLFNTCATNIVQHLNKNFGLEMGWDMRISFPGHSAELAYELDLINTKKSLKDAKTQFKIKKNHPIIDDGKKWSQLIRNKQE